MPAPDVLIDLTPLDTPSRFRGIGRYTAALARGIADLPAADRQGLSFAGLTTLFPWVDDAFDDTLRYPGEPDLSFSIVSYRSYQLKRWMFHGRTAAKTGTRLFHVTDPVTVPQRPRTPVVVTAYDLIKYVLHEQYLSRSPWARPWQRWMDRLRYGGADRIVAISAATKRDLVEHQGLDPSHIDVTLLGVDHEAYHTRAEDGERERVYAALGVDRPFLLYVGAADPRKNVEMLLTAYANSGLATDVPLVLAGMHGRYKGRTLRELAEKLGVTSSVRFTGYLAEELVPATFRTCLAHVFPSSYEGFGLPVVEGMACGAPTITTELSSLAEVAGDAALTIGVDGPDELTAALTRVVEDDALRQDLARRGPPWAQTFTWARCARETIASYRAALASRA